MKHAAQAQWNEFNSMQCGATLSYELNFNNTGLQSSTMNWIGHVIYLFYTSGLYDIFSIISDKPKCRKWLWKVIVVC